MKPINILWVDDEIDLLKIHILFLEEKGYKITTANNGEDAIEIVKETDFDLIFLDENMPGLNGLETLTEIKNHRPNIPVVMITKSEEEDMMDEAIGARIADYLIKPVNPKQILLTIKKHVENKRLVTQKTTSAYQTEFGKLGMLINQTYTFDEWVSVYKKLIYWELELENSEGEEMQDVLRIQKDEANNLFSKFIKSNYTNWFGKNAANRPLLSPDLIKKKVFPLLENGKQVFLILIDNLRFDQWRVIQPKISEYMKVDEEEIFCCILPTATQYARNSIFAGLMPLQIDKMFPNLWLNDEDEGGKNLHENDLLKTQFQRHRKNISFAYEKVLNNREGKKVVDNLSNLLQNQLVVVVYNFVDMLSHARTELHMIRELADDEAAYRSLTYTWFEHSPLLDLIKELAEKDVTIVLTTDHGTIKVNNPIKVIGDKQTTTNLRYKQGKNLNYNPKEVFEIPQPDKVELPVSHMSSSYIFATNKDFFAYPNNYNHYVKYYKNTFHHGGVSLEEMLVPIITLIPK